MTILPIKQPQPNYSSQGPVASKFMLIDPANDTWLVSGAGAPTSGGSGDGNGWTGKGSLYLDVTNGKLYQNTGTMASPTWTVFESSGGAILFSSADALAAHAGGAKTGATALTANVSGVSTVATDGDSVLAPAASAGGIAVIINRHASNGISVYGAGSDTINGVVTTVATYLPAGQTMVLYAPAAATWFGPVGVSANAATESQPAAPTAPASTSTYKMQGLAGAITPKKTGKIQVTIRGNIIGSTTTAGDGILLQGSYGTGAAPANAGNLAGTQVGAELEYTNPATVTAADIHIPFSLTYLITGAAIDTALWLDLAAKSVGTNSAVGLANVDITAIEIG